jgi:hypothetical protein
VNHQDVPGIQREALVEVWCDVSAQRHNDYTATNDRQYQPGYKHDCQGLHERSSHRPSSSRADPSLTLQVARLRERSPYAGAPLQRG